MIINKQRLEVRTDNILLLFHFILLLFVCTPYSSVAIFRQLADILPYANLIYIMLACVKMLRDHNIRNVSFLVLTTLAIAIICALNGSSMGSASAYLTLTFGIYYVCTIGYNDSFMRIVNFIGYLYIIISAFGARNYFTSWNAYSNSINPNTLAVITLLFLLIININWINNSYNKIFVIAINLLAIYNLWSFDSRSCLFGMAFYYVLVLMISRKIKLPFKFFSIITAILFIGGIVFPLFYINTPQWIVSLVTNFTHKTFYSGRQAIWSRFFNTILHNRISFLIGPGSHMESYFGEVNLGSRNAYMSMHSSFLGIMLNFGIVGIILYFVILILHLRDIFATNIGDSYISKICYISYLTFLLVGYAEIILTNSYMVMAFNAFLGIAKYYSFNTKETI